jgi:uncharacterized protein YndB with AHSA1/START domain
MRARPVVVQLSAAMSGPPEIVWEFLTDWEHQDEWMLEATDFVVTTGARVGIGVEAEATIRIAGFTTRDRIRVSRWEPARRLTIEHLGWVQGTGDLRLRPTADGGTDLRWREELRCPSLGPIGWLGLLALRPVVRRVFARDLRVLRGLVRARGLPFGNG